MFVSLIWREEASLLWERAKKSRVGLALTRTFELRKSIGKDGWDSVLRAAALCRSAVFWIDMLQQEWVVELLL